MTFELRNGTVRLGDWTVFDGLSITVAEGEIVSILGPSGCGKTTLLRACCGLEQLAQGERHLGGRVLPNNTIVPEITMLFQQPVLYPHLNVAQNIGLGAGKTVPKKALQSGVNAVLKTVGLEGFNQRGTAGLSGERHSESPLVEPCSKPRRSSCWTNRLPPWTSNVEWR